MGGRTCTICGHTQSAQITKAISAGGSKRQVAARFGVSDAAVLRHKSNCLRQPAMKKAPAPSSAQGTLATEVRFGRDAGEIAGPQDLLDRLSRLLRIGEMLDAAIDQHEVDSVVKLAREYRGAVESYAKVAGWTSDGTTVNVDARRLSIETKLAGLSEADLRAIVAAGRSATPIALVAEVVD